MFSGMGCYHRIGCHGVLSFGLREWGEGVAAEVEPTPVLAVIDHCFPLSTAENGFIELVVVEWFLETVS